MTGPASTESEEFIDIYNLDVTSIPPNIKISRKDLDDEIYRTSSEKYESIVESITESTTTPDGLNHKILSCVSITSSWVNIEPIPPRIENVITIKTIAVKVLTNTFLVKDKNLSALDQSDWGFSIGFSKRYLMISYYYDHVNLF